MKSKNIAVISTVSFGIAIVTLFQNCADTNLQFEFTEVPSKVAIPPVCREVTSEDVKPKLKFGWDAELSALPEYRQVMSTPMVADINGDGIPEIAFTTFKGGAYTSSGVVRVISGLDGKELFSASKTEHLAYGTIAPLLIDIDGDGKGEVIYVSSIFTPAGEASTVKKRNVIALNHDGSERWIHTLDNPGSSCDDSLSAADLDNNGIAEIIGSGFVISEGPDKKPFLKNDLELTGCNNVGLNLHPIRVNSKMSIVNSLGIMDSNGKTIKKFQRSGHTAIADLYEESEGSEIVIAGGGSLQIYSAHGDVLLDKLLTEHTDNTCNGAIGGGQATIGDFDGNPASLEIAIATGKSLTIYDKKGEKISGSLTTDCSSKKTGVASFDFNGDGKPEIVYADEQYLRIYEMDGSNELRSIWETINPSGTLSEFPVVADADGDGYADLIVSQNSYSYSDPENKYYGYYGVRVFSSTTQGAWMPTRPIWNQHSYFINNVSNSLKATAQSYYLGLLPKTFKRNTFNDIEEVKCLK